MNKLRSGGVAAACLVVITGFFTHVSAERFTGGSYTIDASVIGNSFGGSASGGSYKLTTSGGESIIGQGSGGSYKLDSGYVAQLQSSLQLAVQPGNLTGYWPMDENAGLQTSDYSAGANSGELRDGSLWQSLGKVGTSNIGLDGTNDRVVIMNNPAGYEYTGGNLTVEAWVKQSTGDDGGYIVSKAWNGSGHYNYRLSINPTGIIGWYLSSQAGTTSRVLSAGTIAKDTWTHVAATASSTGEMILYINGAVSATGTYSIPNWLNGTNANLPLQWGCLYPYGAGWVGVTGHCITGAIDEAKLFDRVLSANDIKAEYDAGVAGNTAGLSFATDIVAGISQTSPYDAIVLTDAANGYTLAVNQNQNLTNGASTISPVSGTIAAPVSWSEGTTKGLGFTLFGTNATALDPKWSSGNAYAAFPGTSTSYYTRTGRQSAKDVLNMRLRLDVNAAQVSGTYTNVITTTGTITP